jgi:hypothetical protein
MMAGAEHVGAQARSQIATGFLVASILLMPIGKAWPQADVQRTSPGAQQRIEQVVPQQDAPAPPSSPAGSEENPGLFNEIGKMFDKLPTLKSPQQTIDDWNARARDAAKDATDSLSRLSQPASMVSGRMVCPVSASGAPDCKLAADKLCQAKGFKDGKSLNTDSAETCSAKVLIPGRTRKPDDCRTAHYVSRALCQ